MSLLDRMCEAMFEQRFGLDLFLPGAATPLHVTVRPVRPVGHREAFEFVEGTAVDRLTLAEHLDYLLAAHRQSSAKRRRSSEPTRRVSLGAAWKRVLLPFATSRPSWAAG